MSGASIPSEQQQQAMAQPFTNLPIPVVVFNGFAHNHSASEVTSIVSLGARPVLALVMPPVVAKSFAVSLLEIVERYEAATGSTVYTIDELNERISAYNATGQQS